MASQVTMGMVFNDVEPPDFGSIRCTDLKGGANFKGKNQYILKSTDVNKLDLITNAAEGSTAICVDTADLYILHMGEWVKLGEQSTENTAQTQSVNLSPLNISREELTGSESLNESELPDSLTVEPTTENLTDDTSSEELR